MARMTPTEAQARTQLRALGLKLRVSKSKVGKTYFVECFVDGAYRDCHFSTDIDTLLADVDRLSGAFSDPPVRNMMHGLSMQTIWERIAASKRALARVATTSKA